MTLKTLRYGALLSLLVIATACGGNKKAEDNKSAAVSAPKKVLRFIRLQAHRTLDPMKVGDAESNGLVINLYDTLLQYHYLKRPYELEPNLAAKMPELSADGLTYSFELRKDVRFIDDPCFAGGKGRGMNADDVIYSFKRFADANVNIETYPLMAGMVEGMDEFREQTKQLGKATDYDKLQISGLQKVDDYHFNLKLAHKNPIVLMQLAMGALSVVPREAVERYKEELERHPVGTGPFKMKELARRGVIIIEKNPNYHLRYPTEGAEGDAESGLLADAGKQLPLLDEVHYVLMEELSTAVLEFMSGKMDWMGLDKDNFVKVASKDAEGFHLRPDYAKKFRLYWEPTLNTAYYQLNLKDKVIGKNKALRQAIAYALDAQGRIDKMENGRGTALQAIVPLPIAGSQLEVPSKGYVRDVAMAKQKLVEAGYPGGKGLPPITIDYPQSSSSTRQTFEFDRALLAEVGITAKGNFQTWTAYLQRIESGNFQIATHGWSADYPDAENFYQLFYGPNVAPGPNGSNYKNPEYDRLYEQIRFMSPGFERNALFARMNEILHEDVPVIPISNAIVVGLYQPWTKNLKRHVLVNPPFKYMDVDPAAKGKGHN